MKFPRNARILRGQLDFAPFASVFFLVIIFVSLGSLVYTPGVRVEVPRIDGLRKTMEYFRRQVKRDPGAPR